MEKEKLGSFIAGLRRELGLTQQALADQLHVTDKAVSKWERGICYPDLTMLESLAAALGLTVAELIACERHPKETAPTESHETQVRSLLEIASESQQRQKKKSRLLTGLLVLAFLLLTGLILCIAAANRNDSHVVTFVGKKADAKGYFVYVEKDDRLLCLRCPDQQMYDKIEAHKKWAYEIAYSWNFFTYRGTLESCREEQSDDLVLGTPMDTVGSAFIIDSLLGLGRVTQSVKNVYPDPEREGEYLYTFCFSCQRNGNDIRILTVENCRGVLAADYDDDGVTELFVLTQYDQQPYMLYDKEKGEIFSVFVDEVPADILERLN